ncbi:MAG TPA: glycosyltransferase family 4 protein [Kofleriaceae bacterium]|nr:glycosyltransferase family 4 protein [Kofleriaceae bacterium]
MTSQRPIRVTVLGLRGFPNIQGGVEKHAEQLYPRLAALGCQVRVIGRAPFRSQHHSDRWNQVVFDWLWAPRIRGVEALIHSMVGVLVAATQRPDVLHIHAIGPGIVAPIARLLGMKVVITHHGKDYERQKWGRLARTVLRMGERFGMRSANERIAVSDLIRRSVLDTYGVDSVFIPNGIERNSSSKDTAVLAQLGLTEGRYVLQVSRLVPEKRQDDLIAAFLAARLPGWKLAIVGDTEFQDDYSRSIRAASAVYRNVVCTGFRAGDELGQLYRNAGFFVLPSSHEGLPIALLEAVSYCLPVIASDIPANKAIGLREGSYFPLGNVEELARRIRAIASIPPPMDDLIAVRSEVCSRYDWDAIARETLSVYRRVAEG